MRTCVPVMLMTLMSAMLMGSAALAQTTAATTQATTTQATTAPLGNSAAVVVLSGRIDDYTKDSVIKRMDRAKAEGAKTIILELNTPGGQVTSALDITRYLRSQTDVRTVAYVEKMALSAGIMIGLACDELVMSPGAIIGDSAPIMLSSDGGVAKLEGTERAKMESPVLADFYESSMRNGYDPLLTASMVTMSRVVHFVQGPDGKTKFVDNDEYAKLDKDKWKPVAGVPDPIDRADTLLTVHDDLARKLGLSKGTFASPQAFAADRGLSIAQTFTPATGEQIIALLSGGLARFILIIVLMQALYIAFGHPGHGWPEAIAVIALVLLLGVPMLTGYANWLEVLAILLGLALLAVEIFVIPGFGVTGIAGLVLIFSGLVLTFVGSEPAMPGLLPGLRGTWIALQRGLFVVTGGLACSLFLWIWLNRYLPSLPYFNKLILTATTGDIAMPDFDRPLETGPAVGDEGVAVTDLKPGGSVNFTTDSYPDGRVAAVISESGYVTEGTRVVVREVAGNRVVVRTL